MEKISDLEYIALEGGGGKGAVYKGAIQALEEMLHKEHLANALKYRGKTAIEIKSSISDSIFNYTNDDGSLKIKGIAGASTGSINAFALSMGLNSNDIDHILEEFKFQDFLKDIDSGKYRMIGKGLSKESPSIIKVGEDKFKKLGQGIGVKEYQFLGNQKFKVKGNPGKYALRHALVALGFKSILSGILESLNQFSKIFFKIEELSAKTVDAQNVKSALTYLGKLREKKYGLVTLIGIDKIIFTLIFKVFFKNKVKNLVSLDSLGNLLWDRGMFSGFIVREFLFNCMLKALENGKTFCFSNFVDYFIENGISKEKIESIKIDFKERGDKFRQCELSQKQLQKLYSITFEDYYKITKINLVIGATNITTGQPMFFSHKWTPDFPVLEAVGMSMNLPPALKAIFNEADVIFQEKIPASVLRKNKKNEDVIDLDKYQKVLNTVITYIKCAFELQFSLNGNLSFSSYLPYLRDLIEVTDSEGKIELREENDLRMKPTNPKPIGIKIPHKDELLFCYNSVYKGLFIDSGVTNNIPYNAFRVWNNNEMNKTLALKLDNNFPEEYIDELLNSINKKLKVPYINLPLSIPELESGEKDQVEMITPDLMWQINSTLKKINKNFKIDLNKPSYLQIKKALIEIKDERNKDFTPWNKQVNGIGGLLNALQYGFDQGQIRQLSDNNNIIPLYCYGIGTYDFNLKELKPLADFANTQSYNDVKKYFGKLTDKKE